MFHIIRADVVSAGLIVSDIETMAAIFAWIPNLDDLVKSYVMPRYGTVTETILLS